ncbi:MAG: diphthine--ammonia ligase [Candidatus Micrarchaeia archaeon]
MKVVSLFSGGKDSTYATLLAHMQGWDVELLAVLSPPGSYMFHHPNVIWAEKQARAMGFPISFANVSGKKEEEIEELCCVISEFECDGVVSGAVRSEYQKERIDYICENLGIRSFAPLWRKNEKRLIKEMLEFGFEIMITSVSAEGMGRDLLGRIITPELVDEFSKKGINEVFEGGEAETFVVNCPFFSKRIDVKNTKVSWDGVRGELTFIE